MSYNGKKGKLSTQVYGRRPGENGGGDWREVSLGQRLLMLTIAGKRRPRETPKGVSSTHRSQSILTSDRQLPL